MGNIRKFVKGSIKRKLIAVFIVIAAVPLVLTTVITSWLSSSALTKDAFENNRKIAEFLAMDINASLISSVQLLQTMADTEDIQSMDKTKQLAVMKKAEGRTENLSTLIVTDSTGAQTVRTKGALASSADRDYFAKIVSGGDYAISDVQMGRSTGKTSVVIAVPIRDAQKKLKGSLLGVVDLETLSKKIASTQIGNSGYAFLVDRQGKIIMHPDDGMVKEMTDCSNFEPVQEAIGGKSGITSYNYNNQKVLAGYSNVASSGWGVVAQLPSNEAMESADKVKMTGIVFTILGILLAVVVGFYAAGVFVKPIHELVRVTQKVAEGDLSHKVTISSKDELGQLASDFNAMVTHLKELIKAVTQTTELVAASSEELAASANEAEKASNQIAGTMTDFAQGSQKQTQEVEKTLKIVANLTNNSQEVSEKTHSATGLSEKMAKAAEIGGEAARNATDKMNDIKKSSALTADAVTALGEKSNQIGQILEVISDIARQTNLLALNAAIEAARAGKYGSGFAVVAEEVRKLAEQSQHATGKISQIVIEIQQHASQAMKVIEGNNSKVCDGVTVVQAAGQALQDVLDQIVGTVRIINDIDAASRQQVEKMQQMNESTDNVLVIAQETSNGAEMVAAATEEVTASMEEIANSADSLAKMANQLQEITTKFRI
ncbi:MAG: methyl-accepting chemotaxis sensory transducer with Cache sensor [Firmicutes bacterium]|nr:methyl-accepting chemotaxis sensory transducer with Cache sensor [Bacillota bacterium]